jgi:hypothetical protein
MWRCTSPLLVLVALAGPAAAHDTAMSSFDVRPASRGVQVVFRLDAQSVRDLAGDDLLAYLDARFAVTRAGAPCPREAPRALDAGDRVVVIDVVYGCTGEVRLESTLFHDESIPHQVIGTIHAGGRAERYFFTREAWAKTVRIEAPVAGGFRTAAPPPGAFAGPPRPSLPPPPEARPMESGFVAFLEEGVRHILGGLDHLLFVAVLVLAVERARRLAAVVTAFTVGHSVSLALGALGLVSVSPALVEPLIAASIAYVAVEQLARPGAPARLGVIAGFGLVHGLGFSGALAELGFAPSELALPLLGFNLGVEVGQLAVIAPLALLAPMVRARPRVRAAVLGVVALVAAVWTVQRIVAG